MTHFRHIVKPKNINMQQCRTREKIGNFGLPLEFRGAGRPPNPKNWDNLWRDQGGVPALKFRDLRRGEKSPRKQR